MFSLNSFLNESGTEAWAKGISFLFAICLWLFLVPWTVSRRTFNAPHMKNGVTLVFSDQGIRAEYTGIEVFTDWNQIKAGFETSDAIIIKIAKAAHVIPKSQITSEQCDNLKRIVRATCPKRLCNAHRRRDRRVQDVARDSSCPRALQCPLPIG